MTMHILKERKFDGTYKYSQARIYLFLSVLYFFIMMTIITIKSFIPQLQADLNLIKSIMEKLTFPLSLFSGYALIAKGVNSYKESKNGKD